MEQNAPARKLLSLGDAVAIVVCIVIGAGIFKTPAIVAANSGNEFTTLMLWVMGGVISLIGALCYAELASTYPHSGGDYHYLQRTFGHPPAFLFAWARMTVIKTGSIAMIAFLIGDYATEVLNLGRFSAAIYAAITVIVFTVVNVMGIRPGSLVQRVFLGSILIGMLAVAIAGLGIDSRPVQAPTSNGPTMASIGRAMIFVLLTYGGWNEAAYLSAELHETRRNMVRTFLISIGLITFVYVLVNFTMIHGMGLAAMRESEAVAADLMRLAWGESGARLISLLIIIAAVSTINGMMITGARTAYAMGRDVPLFRFLGQWEERGSTPANALYLQGAIALVLVGVGAGTRSGFVMMVEYTAPVFWFFLLLAAISLIVLRWKEPHATRPYRVPLYPLTPLLFCAVCGFMLQSSLAYTGKGALVGVAVLLSGVPILLIRSLRQPNAVEEKG